MNCHQDHDGSPIKTELQKTLDGIWETAKRYEGDNRSLLSLLRSLEGLHREILEQLFEPSLPDTRHDLYNLLREIEETGGWPYIERMKLQVLLSYLLTEAERKDGEQRSRGAEEQGSRGD